MEKLIEQKKIGREDLSLALPENYLRHDELRLCCTNSTKDLIQCLVRVHKCTLYYDADNEKRVYVYKDNGSSVLGIAHMDSHGEGIYQNFYHIFPHPAGTRIYTPTLDDRLGVYTILYHLPSKGIKLDWLFTIDEESGSSTADLFADNCPKQYHWMVSFDRTGDDVVLYDYASEELRSLLTSEGFKIGWGSYSCIREMENLKVKGFNIGVGYYDYHGAYAYLNPTEYKDNLERFVNFYGKHKNTKLIHEKSTYIYTRNVRDDNRFSHRDFTSPYHPPELSKGTLWINLIEKGEQPTILIAEDVLLCWRCGRRTALNALPEKCPHCSAEFAYNPVLF